MSIIANDLIQEVRDGLDEDVNSNVTDGRILRALNRAARSLFNKVAKKLDSVFMTPYAFTATSSLTFPDNMFGQRVEFIEILRGTVNERLQKVHLNQLHKTGLGVPRSYALRGNTVLFDGSSPISGTLYYMRRPADLVKSFGRIVDVGADYVEVDDLDSSVSTDVDSLSAFVNLIDRDNGTILASLQIASISGNIITFKTSGLDRTQAAGRTLATSFTAEVDDYVTSISGSCIIEYLSDYSDYVTQHAVLEIRKSLGEDVIAEVAGLRDQEKEILSMWSGRDADLRIEAKNPHWGRTFRRTL
jgi:hypothetical protein